MSLKTGNVNSSKQRNDSHKLRFETLTIRSDLTSIVKLPLDVEVHDWLSFHIIQFYNELSLLSNVIRKFCTEESCPLMSGGHNYQYLWMSEELGKPIQVSAPKYIDFLMKWLENIVNESKGMNMDLDGNVKDDKMEHDFTQNKSVMNKMARRMCRIYVHIYYAHMKVLSKLNILLHVNTCFQYFFYFVTEHKMVKDKEFMPLKKIIDAF